jgi:hypothetical protein
VPRDAVEEKADTDERQGRALTIDEHAPSTELVLPGCALLTNLAQTFDAHAALPKHASTALALGTMFSYTLDAFTVAPNIAVTSPIKRCGKTTLITLASSLCQRALLTSNMTPATVFRAIEKYAPTLFLDEADTVFEASDELRTVFNAGHTLRTAMVLRTVGDDHEPRAFSTWCPKWIALIGELPGTLADRSITITMQRRPRGAKLLRLRQDKPPPVQAHV